MLHVHVTYTCFNTDNKRLDEWVSEDRLDLEKIQLPRKDCKSSATNTIAAIKNMSRASSPDITVIAPPTSFLPHDIIRRTSVAGRKRKNEAGDVRIVY